MTPTTNTAGRPVCSTTENRIIETITAKPKRLTVVWVRGLEHKNWIAIFQHLNTIEVTRETKKFYIIAPMGFELRVSKASMHLTGFKDGYGVQFVD